MESAMYSMAVLPSAMLVRPDACSVPLRSGGSGRAKLRVPGVAWRASRVQIAVRREVRGGAYRSAFLARGLVAQRRPAVLAIGVNRRRPFVVHAGAGGVEEKDGGSRECFEEKSLDRSFGREVEILAAENGDENLMTVEEIEVPGVSDFSHDVELETDVVHQSTRQQPELVKYLRKIARSLQGLKEREDAVLELSSSVKEKKLRWNPLGFLNGSTPSATEKLRNKVFDGLRRAEDDFFAVCSVVCHANMDVRFAKKSLDAPTCITKHLFYGKSHCGLLLSLLLFYPSSIFS